MPALGAPSHAAAEALELGYDAVLLNTAVAKADNPVAMANAFRLAVEAGRSGVRSRPDGPARLRLSFNPRHWDSVLACSILIVFILSSTASPGSRRLTATRRRHRAVAREGSRPSRQARRHRDARGARGYRGHAAPSSSSTITGSAAIEVGAQAPASRPGRSGAGRREGDPSRRHLTLGLSTHDDAELDNRAPKHAPDYIALGPIFPTTLKAMRFGAAGHSSASPNGSADIGEIPLVAIGGIKFEQAKRNFRGWRGFHRRRQRRDPERQGPRGPRATNGFTALSSTQHNEIQRDRRTS